MVTNFILAACVIFSIMGFNNRELFWKYLFSAYGVVHQRQYYRIFTHAFLHGDYMHLGFNMIALYSFGEIVESTFFPRFFGELAMLYYILLYAGGIVAATIPELIRQRNNPSYTSVGASGAVNAVVFASILIYPQGKISLMFLPGIPSWIFGILFLIYSWYMSKRGGDNIGHNAHFWGAIYGLVFTAVLKPGLIETFLNRVF